MAVSKNQFNNIILTENDYQESVAIKSSLNAIVHTSGLIDFALESMSIADLAAHRNTGISSELQRHFIDMYHAEYFCETYVNTIHQDRHPKKAQLIDK